MSKHFFAAGHLPDCAAFRAFGVGKTPKTAYRQAYKRTPVSLYPDPRDCVEITRREYERLRDRFADSPFDVLVYPEDEIGDEFTIDDDTALAARIVRGRILVHKSEMFSDDFLAMLAKIIQTSQKKEA